MKNFHRVIIIGSGPIGLYFANKCEKENLDYIILEGYDSIGGQLTRLYPEKEIVDIPSIKSIKAGEYIAMLAKEIPSSKILLNSYVKNIKSGEFNEIYTEKTTYFCEYLIIATGLGTPIPRPLGVDGEEGCKNIFYSLKSYDHLKGKRIAIFGGGDSALDWSRTLSGISDNVHLIHRRTEFRGNAETIKDCKNLTVHVPFVPSSLNVNNDVATSVVIKNVSTEETLEIPIDYIFVNYGNVASFTHFPFKMQDAFLVVDQTNKVEKNIFAIGDVCNYENKVRRIAPGINEADKVFTLIR